MTSCSEDSSSPALTGEGCSTVKHMLGHGATVHSLLCFSEGLTRPYRFWVKLRILLTRKSLTASKRSNATYTRFVASGCATESSASHRRLAGSERCKYGWLPLQVRGHNTFRQNSHKTAWSICRKWSGCLDHGRGF